MPGEPLIHEGLPNTYQAPDCQVGTLPLFVPGGDANAATGDRVTRASLTSFPCLGERRALHQTPIEALPPHPRRDEREWHKGVRANGAPTS